MKSDKLLIAMNNATFKTAEVERSMHEGFNAACIEKWNSHVEHVRAIETTMWKAIEITTTAMRDVMKNFTETKT